jgi:hypothetical protein
MTEPELSDEDARTLLARRKFAEERRPLSPALRGVREALAKARPEGKTVAATAALDQQHHRAAEAEALIKANPLHPWRRVWC